MAVTGSGKVAGSVSGGCLEEDLVRKARWLTESGAVVRRYDTTPDGEIAAEYGLGCNGIIHVLLERVKKGQAAVLDLIEEVRSERRPAAVAHVLSPASAAGQRLVIGTRGHRSSNISDAGLAARLEKEAEAALLEGHSRGVRLETGEEAFVETLAPAVHLLVFGAGDDAVPLTNLANSLGWRVSVFDGREHYARREKFPAAAEVAVVPAGRLGGRARIDAWTAAVLMSHSYSQDLENLRELAAQPLRYLGILGPRKRTVELLADAGLNAAENLEALHSPMGLDIGADGPEQVALSVVAEIQATLNGRQGGLLRDRQGPIHAPGDAASDAEVNQSSTRARVRSIVCA